MGHGCSVLSNKFCVEDCERFDVSRELFRSRAVKFNAVTTGEWRGLHQATYRRALDRLSRLRIPA